MGTYATAASPGLCGFITCPDALSTLIHGAGDEASVHAYVPRAPGTCHWVPSMVSVRFALCEGALVVLASVKSAELEESVRLAAEKGTMHPWWLSLDADATMPLYGAYGSPPAG